MRILGIDPGSRHTGYGLVEKRGARVLAVAGGRFSCPPRASMPERLAFLTRELDALVERLRPDRAVLEAVFHSRNSRSLIVLAQARGALLATLGRHGLAVQEYSPAEVKSAVCGNGRAGKAQIERMVRVLLDLEGEQLTADAADALAVALCGARRLRLDSLSERARPARPSAAGPATPARLER